MPYGRGISVPVGVKVRSAREGSFADALLMSSRSVRGIYEVRDVEPMQDTGAPMPAEGAGPRREEEL